MPPRFCRLVLRAFKFKAGFDDCGLRRIPKHSQVKLKEVSKKSQSEEGILLAIKPAFLEFTSNVDKPET